MGRPGVEIVSPMARGGESEVGSVLGRAFLDDPLWTAVFADDRLAKLTSMFTSLARTTIAGGGIVEVTREVSGAAVWMPPVREIGLRAMIASGFSLPRFSMSLPKDERKLMLGVLQQLDKRREQLMPIPHWYLSAVGVDPPRHGEGLGSALVRSGLLRAQREGRSVYLETETESNVAFYQHLGFEVLEKTFAAGLQLPIWLMSRT